MCIRDRDEEGEVNATCNRSHAHAVYHGTSDVVSKEIACGISWNGATNGVRYGASVGTAMPGSGYVVTQATRQTVQTIYPISVGWQSRRRRWDGHRLAQSIRMLFRSLPSSPRVRHGHNHGFGEVVEIQMGSYRISIVWMLARTKPLWGRQLYRSGVTVHMVAIVTRSKWFRKNLCLCKKRFT